VETTYKVSIRKTGVYKGKRGTTYYVRWAVAGQPWKQPFKARALAESFRAEPVAAARKGEAFDVETGRPVSMRRTNRDMSWYEFACAFVDMQWPRVAATTRRTHAEALTPVTVAMFANDRGRPDDKLIRSALTRWGFNTARRNADDCPGEVRDAPVSTWLNGGVPPTTVAAWAGHSVEVLLKIYAKCLDGEAALLRQRVQAALGHR